MKNNHYYYLKPVANIYAKANARSEITSQILYGEKFKVLYKNADPVEEVNTLMTRNLKSESFYLSSASD